VDGFPNFHDPHNAPEPDSPLDFDADAMPEPDQIEPEREYEEE
jgi:hypothetical protein